MPELAKNTLFFSFDSLIAYNDYAKKSVKEKAVKLFERLKALQKKHLLNMILISGLPNEYAVKLLEEERLSHFFEKKDVFFVTDEYLNKKEKIDRQRYLFALKKDPMFRDDFLKQVVIQEYLKEKGIPKEKAAFICSDILTEAFYTSRFSGIDFFVIKSIAAFRGEKIDSVINGINYIALSWLEFKKLLYGKNVKQNTAFLEAFVYRKLQKELMPDLNKQLSMRFSGVKK